jgi:hypothetical protein
MMTTVFHNALSDTTKIMTENANLATKAVQMDVTILMCVMSAIRLVELVLVHITITALTAHATEQRILESVSAKGHGGLLIQMIGMNVLIVRVRLDA